MKRFKVGLIGCGAISKNYLRYAQEAFSDYYQITAVADILPERAQAKAEQFGIENYGTPDIIYEDDTLDLVINLTIPAVHEDVSIKILQSGKHLYSEKPLAISREGITHILSEAEKAGKRVGCAPDSFLSAPAQTAKKALEEDWIGAPIGFTATCARRGNEFFRADSDFFYKKGAGPMMDMAPYYLNILVSMFGGVDAVATMSKITFPERTIKAQPRRGEKIAVEVPTYVSSTLRFENGVIGTFLSSFDIWGSQCPHIEIYGEKGSIVIPDPNRYTGDVLLKRFKSDWQPLPQFSEYNAYGRGIGIVDMIRSMEAGIPHKASGELARHVTDVILTMDEASQCGHEIKLNTTASPVPGLWTNQETDFWK